MTFSDQECEVDSNYEGNIVCRTKFELIKRKGAYCSGHNEEGNGRKSSAGGYELQQSIGMEDISTESNAHSQNF